MMGNGIWIVWWRCPTGPQRRRRDASITCVLPCYGISAGDRPFCTTSTVGPFFVTLTSILALDVVQTTEAYSVYARTLTLRLLHSMQPLRDLVCVLLVPFGRVSAASDTSSMDVNWDIVYQYQACRTSFESVLFKVPVA
jgi:hypothetical protein